ncbi:MAG: hypothetical protein CMF96_09430 [Candidatus Marinimicrobia bacterium]|nr:hypothetical protein [Candidatus Neomarinimicrobiota bacterium]|tara:strand:- start:2459 stop:3220 length:762 start_codon:yes stop_codon:yes gene_type:complete
MKTIKVLFINFLCFILFNCSGNEKSKVVDIFPDGSPKEIEVYSGNPPKMELSKILFISSFGDTAITINVEKNDTIMPEIKKEIVKQKYDNGQSMIVEHWIILGLEENLAEIHYFDNMSDILKIDDKINGRIKKYAELHPELGNTPSPNNPLKEYLYGQWNVASKFSGKKYLSEFKGGVYTFTEINNLGKKLWEEMYSINYNWDFNIVLRMLNKGFPKSRIKVGRRVNYQLNIDTKDRFELIDAENQFIFTRIK